MNVEITIRKVKASSETAGMKKIKKQFPYSKLLLYKFEKDFRFELNKDFKNRKIIIAFVKDIRTLRGKL